MGRRSIEHGMQIDIESDRTLEIMGVEDPEYVRKIWEDVSGGRRVFGLQDDSLACGSYHMESVPPYDNTQKMVPGVEVEQVQ